jgi:hypothetical protein
LKPWHGGYSDSSGFHIKWIGDNLILLGEFPEALLRKIVLLELFDTPLLAAGLFIFKK